MPALALTGMGLLVVVPVVYVLLQAVFQKQCHEHDQIYNAHDLGVCQRGKIMLPQGGDNLLNDNHGLS